MSPEKIYFIDDVLDTSSMTTTCDVFFSADHTEAVLMMLLAARISKRPHMVETASIPADYKLQKIHWNY